MKKIKYLIILFLFINYPLISKEYPKKKYDEKERNLEECLIAFEKGKIIDSTGNYFQIVYKKRQYVFATKFFYESAASARKNDTPRKKLTYTCIELLVNKN